MNLKIGKLYRINPGRLRQENLTRWYFNALSLPDLYIYSRIKCYFDVRPYVLYLEGVMNAQNDFFHKILYIDTICYIDIIDEKHRLEGEI